MTSYAVFPGIELIYNDVHAQECTVERPPFTGGTNLVEINHCREGRIECEFHDEFVYLSQGDVSVSANKNACPASFFPGGHYHGITILIDTSRAPDCLSCFLEDVNVELSALISRFCSDDTCFIMRAKPCIEHIFSELYAVPESIRKGYFKVKVLELLLFLNSIDPAEERSVQNGISRSQMELAKGVNRLLTDNLDRRYTIDQLSDCFHASPTQIKNSFRSVYGTSIYAFVKTQKMHEAALLLRKTNQSILEIAGEFGYDNGSKFARAFRGVMGAAPSEYRNDHGNV
ncbi:MAG: helix-turn-helix domain-containing protein [Eubacteriaceae bacterium]|jgi:AraC-like DNA-binding protein